MAWRLKVVEAQACSSAGSIPERVRAAPKMMFVRWARPSSQPISRSWWGKGTAHQPRVGMGEQRREVLPLPGRIALGGEHEGQRLVERLAGAEHRVQRVGPHAALAGAGDHAGERRLDRGDLHHQPRGRARRPPPPAPRAVRSGHGDQDGHVAVEVRRRRRGGRSGRPSRAGCRRRDPPGPRRGRRARGSPGTSGPSRRRRPRSVSGRRAARAARCPPGTGARPSRA